MTDLEADPLAILLTFVIIATLAAVLGVAIGLWLG